ncbi:hypothetical protein [Geminocystis sp. GBBB08]|uniref:hypothetical protein n=1 Tax=Geminocystis sp. GBBB08 TaxID=2604140 RepID=UPI0027E3AE1A|nr:hypothetical protein [Geminocystis sp. GBBB08]MBL1209305.1 hypothetical protein [Geminocystis sp. GBBB08]
MRENREQNLDKLQLSLYLMPLFGPIWALIRLKFFPHNLDSQQKKTSRLSLKLGMFWLITYSTLWVGGCVTSELLSIRLLYFNGIITTTYFLLCLILISRLWSQNLSKPN